MSLYLLLKTHGNKDVNELIIKYTLNLLKYEKYQKINKDLELKLYFSVWELTNQLKSDISEMYEDLNNGILSCLSNYDVYNRRCRILIHCCCFDYFDKMANRRRLRTLSALKILKN